MTIHTEALRPGARAPGSGGGALTPEEIVQRMRDEVVAESAPARSFSDSVIDLSSMETVPVEHLPSGAGGVDDDPSKRIEALRVGDRQRVFLQRPLEPRPAALAQRPQPLLPVRRRIAVSNPFDHAARARAAQLGRAGAADRSQAAGPTRDRPDDARHLAARLIAVARSAAESQRASARSISAATNAGRSWTIQCVAPGTRTTCRSGT